MDRQLLGGLAKQAGQWDQRDARKAKDNQRVPFQQLGGDRERNKD
jgi:hypothetical protein